jgi:hypothetical protein
MKPARLPFALSGGALSQRRKLLWIATLALSPLAYFGATALESRLPQAPRPVEVTRDVAVQRAVAFARTLDIDAHDWAVRPNVSTHDTVTNLFRKVRVPALDDVVAPSTIFVRMTGPKPDQWMTVDLTPSGRIVGYSGPKPRNGDPVDEGRDRDVARQFLVQMLGPDHPFELGGATVAKTDKQGSEREFVWEAKIPGLPQGKLAFHVKTASGRVVSERRSVELDPAYEESLTTRKPWKTPFVVFVAIYFVGLGIYSIYRYVRRSIEKEISHWRTLLVVVLFTIGGVLLLVLSGEELRSSPGEPSTPGQTVMLWAMVAFGFAIAGLYFGVAYGAGEGDLREAYPGKLCSLDAFLSGKPFSANFARSLLAGGAVAGWLLLLENVLLLVAGGGPPAAGSGIRLVGADRFPFALFVWEMSFKLLVMVAFGILQPLTVLRKYVRRTWLVYVLFVPACAMVAWAMVPDRHPWQNNLIFDGMFVAAVCLPFFMGDLVAAVSCLVAVDYIGALLRRSVESTEWHDIAYYQVLPVATVFLLVELYFAWRGRIYREEEVHPRYARNLAERLALTAEIGAARMAQLRLLPDAPPRIAGLAIAGSCIPAREVGGDFFDYYALDEHRLGVFLAEGGNRELGSAMTIALAKGFLMYTARMDLPPVEILRRLRAALASVLRGEDAHMAVLYAVIDSRNGSVRYARAGDWPRLAVNGKSLAEEIVADRGDGFTIRHGAAMLATLDTIFFYTDGWAAQIAERTRKGPEDFLVRTARKLGDVSAAELHHALVHAALRRKDAPPDDVTAVMVQREDTAASIQAVGGIA